MNCKERFMIRKLILLTLTVKSFRKI